MTALLPLLLAAVELLRPGLYHKGEVAARSGADWLALAPSGSGWEWRRCAVEIEPALDPVVDQDSERTGSQVKAGCGTAPLVLVRGLDRLEKVKVETVAAGKRVAQAEVLRLGSAVYVLSASTAIVLRAGSVSQTLREWPAGARDARCDLLWAGDLDGDGRLDLILAATAQGAPVETVLYLSSAAAGKLVGEAGRLRTAGD